MLEMKLRNENLDERAKEKKRKKFRLAFLIHFQRDVLFKEPSLNRLLPYVKHLRRHQLVVASLQLVQRL